MPQKRQIAYQFFIYQFKLFKALEHDPVYHGSNDDEFMIYDTFLYQNTLIFNISRMQPFTQIHIK